MQLEGRVRRVREVRQQELEVAGHFDVLVRKQGDSHGWCMDHFVAIVRKQGDP